MKIAQIKYGQKKNLGDYQSRDLEIVGIVEENESDADAFLFVVLSLTLRLVQIVIDHSSDAIDSVGV